MKDNEKIMTTCDDVSDSNKSDNKEQFSEFSQICNSLARIDHRGATQQQQEDIKAEWILLALVLDRCFLILFMFLSGIVSVIFLANKQVEDHNKKIY